jgi:hypothetical protein
MTYLPQQQQGSNADCKVPGLFISLYSRSYLISFGFGQVLMHVTCSYRKPVQNSEHNYPKLFSVVFFRHFRKTAPFVLLLRPSIPITNLTNS